MNVDVRTSRRAIVRAGGGALAAGLALPGFGAAQRVNETARLPLWRPALRQGIVFGSSVATWQIENDPEYRALLNREAAILFTEDDLLWYKLKPTPEAELDFTFGDQIIELAEAQNQLVLGAHLVWDEGFGEGWSEDDLWGMNEATARALIKDTVTTVVQRYKGRVAAWIVVNEVIDAATQSGLRTEDYPWINTYGPTVVADAFRFAHAADPDALLILNEFGFETDDEYDKAADKRRNALKVIDRLLSNNVPVHAFGIQAHLHAKRMATKFNARAYREFLKAIADRGLNIFITELDVLDDGLPKSAKARDRAVADAYERYLETALDEPAVISLVTFGLTDRYTWLEEDYPREDGAPRRPLPFDEELRPKPAFKALSTELKRARKRANPLKPLRSL